MAVPETRYARRPDGVNIGYQMLGTGSATLVWCWGWMSHLDLQWADAAMARMFERLASFCQLVIYDKPGTGVSDPIMHVPTLEERVEDVRVVTDAAGFEHSAILGESEAGMARGLINALLRIDVRPALSAISAPTIVMHRRGDLVPIAHGRLLADRIPGARMIELAGSDHAIWTEDADVIVGEIEQLPTGSRAAAEPDRVLATVLFTDIVESTRHAAELGRARVGAHAEAGQILVSKTVVDLVVGSELQFSDCGEHELKGVPGAWRLYAVSFDSSDERTHVEPPREYMTGADRLAVRLARRAPGAMQTLGRLAQRGARPAEPQSIDAGAWRR